MFRTAAISTTSRHWTNQARVRCVSPNQSGAREGRFEVGSLTVGRILAQDIFGDAVPVEFAERVDYIAALYTNFAGAATRPTPSPRNFYHFIDTSLGYLPTDRDFLGLYHRTMNI